MKRSNGLMMTYVDIDAVQIEDHNGWSFTGNVPKELDWIFQMILVPCGGVKSFIFHVDIAREYCSLTGLNYGWHRHLFKSKR